MALLGSRATSQNIPGTPRTEQSLFAMENVPISRPVDLPNSALQLLRKNGFVLSCAKEDQQSEHVITYWFIGSEVHLHGGDEIDLIVQPRYPAGGSVSNACLYHAHSIPFWVLKRTPAGHALVLEEHTQVLQVLNNKTNGCRDIETSMSTTLGQTKSLFKFDGQKYKLYKRTTTPPE